MSESDRRRPRLAPGWEAQAQALNPAEGFLLSRIDGHTTWAVLREIGGFTPEEVDLALESWVKSGLVTLDAEPEGEPAPERSPRGDPPAAPPAEIDASLDLDVELQSRILEFEARLGEANYYEVLGVERGADARQIKRAYFEVSKQFHPDRYFRRAIGHFAPRLDRIFKHVALAYELLSDPATRSEVERSMASAPPQEGAYRQTGASSERIGPDPAKPGGYRKPSRMENLERLRSRFKMPKKVMIERRFKAMQFHRSAQAAAHQKRWLEAGASARLAIAFDPWNPEFKETFGSIQAQVHAARAAELLEQVETADAKGDALGLLNEAIHYRPADPALQGQAALLALETGELERAEEYARNACELDPDTAAYHVTLSRVLRRSKNHREAREALSTAVRLAPSDPYVMQEQKRTRSGC